MAASPVMPVKSHEEYEAEAMLLGLSYDRSTHTFYSRKAVPDAQTMEFDADTLHALSNSQVADRMVYAANHNTYDEWVENARKLEAQERKHDAEARNAQVPHHGEDAAV